MRLRLLLLAVLCACLSLRGWTMLPVAQPENALIGLGDRIIAGTVTAVLAVPGAPAGTLSEATVQIDRTLKGAPATTATFRFAGSADGPHTEESVVLRPHDQAIFFLQRVKTGYQLLETRHMADIENIAKMVAEFPVTVAMTAGPFYNGQTAVAMVTLTNHQPQQRIYYRVDRPEAFFYAPQLTESPAFSLITGRVYWTLPTTVDPGQSLTFPVHLQPALPPALAFFGPDSYLQTAIALRVRLLIDTDPDTKQEQLTNAGHFNNRYFPVGTPWITTTLGYPLPGAEGAPAPAK